VTYRILLVDDYEPWRHHLKRTVLAHLARWQVVGEASDGLGAVERARELRPDLILLDIGLPKLDGIQAAAQILAHDPGARILFVSDHRAPGIVDAALAIGGRGYVVKSEMGTGLLPAMSAIVAGGQFLSSSVTPALRVTVQTGREAGAARGAAHWAGFYADEESLLDDYARFAEAALMAGSTLMVLAVQSRQPLMRQQLDALIGDVDVAIGHGRLRLFDVENLLSTFVVDDRLDDSRFWATVTPLISQAIEASRPTGRETVWGECAPTLWRRGQGGAAVRLEQLWDDLTRRYDVTTLCGYPSIADVDDPVYQTVCAAHTAVHVR